MARVRAKMTGFKALKKALIDEPNKLAQKANRSAVGKAMTPVRRDAAKMLRPGQGYRFGFLKKSISKRTKNYRTDDAAVSLVGAQYKGPKGAFTGPDGKKHVPSNYDHLVHNGHRLVRDGQTVGRVSPIPYLERAMKKHEKTFSIVLAKEYKKALAKFKAKGKR